MAKIFLLFHLVFVGIWLGCVLTEALFERALLGEGRDKELVLSRLHKRVDVLIEIPAFTLVLVTGVLLLVHAPASALLHVKLAFAALAIAANVYCVHLVFKRHRLAAQDDWPAFESVDHLQHRMGAVVLLGMLVTLGLGLYLSSRPSSL